MREFTKYGCPRCEGIKLNGFQCREPKDLPSKYCHYCDSLVKGLTTPGHPGFDPRKRQTNHDGTDNKPWSKKIRR